MYLFRVLLSVAALLTIQSLKPFDPWESLSNSCEPSMATCEFHLEATNAMTMFYKQLFRVIATDNGTLQKYDDEDRTFAVENIITGDGYPKLVNVFNHSLPGPVLHVYRNQTIFIRIFNNLPLETLSVHFHGIRQVETAPNDGVGRVTQLSILPGSSFQLKFVAVDEGTFWYHSHVSTQTAMGLLGAFIVHPKVKPIQTNKEFVLVLQDWQHFYTSEEHQLLVESGQFYPNSLESIMSSGTIDYFQAVDNSRVAEALVTSILINGRGQYIDPHNNESSNTPFERLLIDPSTSRYLIRLINGGSTFSIVFSIDEHQFQVISSDGVPFHEPITTDKLIIGLGERYDILVDVSSTLTNASWWIRADTMDKNNNPRWHGRAILQVGDDNQVKPTSHMRTCTSEKPCYILNCPFTQYGSEANTICLTMKNMNSDSNHIDKGLVSDEAHVNIKQYLSLTTVEGTDETSSHESFNYVSMRYPALDQPILYLARKARETFRCSNITNSSLIVRGQKCYNNLVAQFDDIIEFIIVNHDSDQHPMHLHGSYFHVIEQGLPEINETTGHFIGNNPNVICDDDDINCICVNCSQNTVLVKDTIIIPSGGYMRIRFRATNPGVWLFHCHTETHLDRGMAIMIHVAEDRIEKLFYSSSSPIVTHNNHLLWILFFSCFLSSLQSTIHHLSKIII